MARKGPRNPRQTAVDDEDADTSTDTKKPTPGAPPQTWFEEHWHGWIKPVSGLFIALIAYLVYSSHLVSERFAGPVVVAVIVLGSILMAVLPAYSATENVRLRQALLAFAAVWAVAVGYPSLRAAFPPAPLAEVRLGDTKEHLSDKLTLPSGTSGPLELRVSGALKGTGDASTNYNVKITDANNDIENVEGELKRESSTVRSRRSSSTVHLEKTEDSHRLETVKGTSFTVQIDNADESLENGLSVGIVHAGLDPRIFYVLGALAVLVGLWFDYRLATPKVKTYLTMAAGLTAVFAWDYPLEASPSRLVPAAIGSLIKALIIGGFGGALIAFIARLYKPMKKMIK